MVLFGGAELIGQKQDCRHAGLLAATTWLCNREQADESHARKIRKIQGLRDCAHEITQLTAKPIAFE
jgi:hypothetical protein